MIGRLLLAACILLLALIWLSVGGWTAVAAWITGINLGGALVVLAYKAIGIAP